MQAYRHGILSRRMTAIIYRLSRVGGSDIGAGPVEQISDSAA